MKVALSRKKDSDVYELVSRDICENPDNGYVQLIAGIVLMDSNKNLLLYKRASNITEERLAGKLSCIIGGHIEELPDGGTDNRRIPEGFTHNNAVRELEEEFPGIWDRILYIDSNITPVLVNAYYIPPVFDLSDVEKVHEACLYIYKVPDLKEIMDGITPNEDEVESYHFLNVKDLKALPEINDTVNIDGKEYILENWAVCVIRHLKINIDFFS